MFICALSLRITWKENNVFYTFYCKKVIVLKIKRENNCVHFAEKYFILPIFLTKTAFSGHYFERKQLISHFVLKENSSCYALSSGKILLSTFVKENNVFCTLSWKKINSSCRLSWRESIPFAQSLESHQLVSALPYRKSFLSLILLEERIAYCLAGK